MIKLFDLATKYSEVRFSPYCWRIKYALAHKGLNWEEVPVCFSEKEQLPVPNDGKVPVLVDGDEVVFDSWDIALFLDKKYPQHLLFDSDESRAQSLFVKCWSETVLHSLVSRMAILDFFGLQKDVNQIYFRESREKLLGVTLEEWGGNPKVARIDFLKALEPLRQILSCQAFLGGKSSNFSDYIMVGIFQWLRCGSGVIIFDRTDDVYAYQERLLDLFNGLGRSAPAYPKENRS
ncbi:MAG: glutathione S-transferase N-terminal domain-containing protein [Proteobacteria bacterium]|nr:glutathione S-transferase N-terminal domain-containing protein [Pseudomonadota bacterium]